MPRFLISGGTGFIGRNLVGLLTSSGEDFSIIDRKPRGDGNVIVDDITKPFEAPDADVFVHLAAETSVRESLIDPKSTFMDNCKGTLNCLEFAIEKSFSKFIYASSVSAPSMTSPYLASKFSSEALCISYKNSFGLDSKITRLSNVFGPHSEHKTSIVHKFIKNCILHCPLIIYGSGQQTRDFIYVGDVVQSIYNASNNGGATVSDVCSGTLTSIDQIAHMIAEISADLTGYRPDIRYTDAIPGEVIHPQTRLGIHNPVNIITALRPTFKWYLENYKYAK